MATRAPQPSVTSLARYAVAKQPGIDLFNGKSSRDFCNSFWGVGDAGPNLMFARMRGTSKTTDELRNFWNERCVVDMLFNRHDPSDCTLQVHHRRGIRSKIGEAGKGSYRRG